jgi:hypothetical protein
MPRKRFYTKLIYNLIQKNWYNTESRNEYQIILRYVAIRYYSSLLPFSPTNQCSLFLNSTLNVVNDP